MDRRKFAALIAGGVAAQPNAVTAQTVELRDCVYQGTMGNILKMMVDTLQNSSLDEVAGQELGFELLRIIAVARAGYSVLNEEDPLPGFETSHRLLLQSLETMSNAEDDIKLWVKNADADALSRGGGEIMQGLDSLVEASKALPEDAIDFASRTQDIPEQPTRTPVAAHSETPAPARATETPTTSGVTLANFNRLGEGMSYQEVVSILGSPGELISSSNVAGIKTEMYQWEGNALGANMNAMFQDGKLISKAQFGLE